MFRAGEELLSGGWWYEVAEGGENGW